MTWRYLRVSSNSADVNFTVAAASATDAATVAGTFHPLRAPLLLPHTIKRISIGCPATPSLPSSPSRSAPPLSASSSPSGSSHQSSSEAGSSVGEQLVP
ncbi:hypothetical protein CLOP_g12145 [Closterium sp. NIES-67]|nr:hypothetical protein CLOP_g12145 [Closterium sp. NIES-67]